MNNMKKLKLANMVWEAVHNCMQGTFYDIVSSNTDYMIRSDIYKKVKSPVTNIVDLINRNINWSIITFIKDENMY